MKKSFAQPADADELRRRAEEQLREKRKMQGAEGSDQGAAVCRGASKPGQIL